MHPLCANAAMVERRKHKIAERTIMNRTPASDCIRIRVLTSLLLNCTQTDRSMCEDSRMGKITRRQLLGQSAMLLTTAGTPLPALGLERNNGAAAGKKLRI